MSVHFRVRFLYWLCVAMWAGTSTGVPGGGDGGGSSDMTIVIIGVCVGVVVLAAIIVGFILYKKHARRTILISPGEVKVEVIQAVLYSKFTTSLFYSLFLIKCV